MQNEFIKSGKDTDKVFVRNFLSPDEQMILKEAHGGAQEKRHADKIKPFFFSTKDGATKRLPKPCFWMTVLLGATGKFGNAKASRALLKTTTKAETPI